MQRRVIGDPKAGLTLRISETPTTMTLEARPDPVMLYIVLAAAGAAGLIGTLASSPPAGVLSFLALVFLFLPLISVLAFNAVRIRCVSVIDRERDTLEIQEQSYTRRSRDVHPLEDVEGVQVRKMPPGPLSGGAWAFGLFLVLRDADYLAAWSNNEVTIGQDAARIARFLDVPLETPADIAEAGRNRTRVVLTTGILYLIPILLAISALAFISQDMPGIQPSLAGFLGAVMISQVGALLAFGYYRMRRPYET
ncbi:MAG TPA: hypothetical protein VFC51_04700 [Chloroflexota bacterium]|nr:hypothetical protein [Chloroflexota bacterium]